MEARMSRSFTAAMLLIAVASCPTLARDLGQWQNADPSFSAWYRNLRQPDRPMLSCCGEADAYFADEFEVVGDEYVAIVTDTRDDEALRRPHVAPGTRI